MDLRLGKFYIPSLLRNEFVSGLFDIQQAKSSFRSGSVFPGSLQNFSLSAPSNGKEYSCEDAPCRPLFLGSVHTAPGKC